MPVVVFYDPAKAVNSSTVAERTVNLANFNFNAVNLSNEYGVGMSFPSSKMIS